MYKIGEFSKITKVSARMIRYYDKENILKPSFIESNGYRYYNDNDIEIINKIKKLRRYEFTYGEIKKILSNEQEDSNKIYTNKLNELIYFANKYDILITELENINNKNIANNYEINICEKPSTYALHSRLIIDKDELDIFIESLFNKACKSSISNLGHYYIMFYDNENLNENTYDIGYYQPILEYKKIDGFEIVYNESHMYISTLHYGKYENIHNAYKSLYKWSKNNNFLIKGDFIEKYYVDSSLTRDEEKFITEVSAKISKYV